MRPWPFLRPIIANLSWCPLTPSAGMTDLQSSLFLVDGFQISPGSSFLGDTGAPDNMPDVPGLGHFRLETCLPESRDNHDELPDTGVSVISINQRGSHISVMSSPPSQTPLIKPPPPPKPANISAKLLDLKRNKNSIGNENKTTVNFCMAEELKYDSINNNLSRPRINSDSNNNSANIVTLAVKASNESETSDSVRKDPDNNEDSARTTPGSKIPILASHLHSSRAQGARSDNHLAHKVFLNIESGKVGAEEGAPGIKLRGRGRFAGSDCGDPPLLRNIGNGKNDEDSHASSPLSLSFPRPPVPGSQIPRPFTPVSSSSSLRKNHQGGSLMSLPMSGRATPVQLSSSYSRTRACHQRRGSADVGGGPSSLSGSGVSRIPISIHQQTHHHQRSRETLSLSLSGSADGFEVLR